MSNPSEQQEPATSSTPAAPAPAAPEAPSTGSVPTQPAPAVASAPVTQPAPAVASAPVTQPAPPAPVAVAEPPVRGSRLTPVLEQIPLHLILDDRAALWGAAAYAYAHRAAVVA